MVGLDRPREQSSLEIDDGFAEEGQALVAGGPSRRLGVGGDDGRADTRSGGRSSSSSSAFASSYMYYYLDPTIHPKKALFVGLLLLVAIYNLGWIVGEGQRTGPEMVRRYVVYHGVS